MSPKILFAGAVVVSLLLYFSLAEAVNWQESKDKHFIAYHVKADKPFARKVLKKSEGYYKSMPKKLGITRYSNFWTWDNRVKLYLYSDRATFLNETGKPQWARAVAN